MFANQDNVSDFIRVFPRTTFVDINARFGTFFNDVINNRGTVDELLPRLSSDIDRIRRSG
jgi:hypothetical protein